MNLRIDLCFDNMDINQDNNKFGYNCCCTSSIRSIIAF